MGNLSREKIIKANEISKLMEVTLGGYKQKILIEGKKKTNPVVIFLHGGPGTPIPFCEGCRGLFPEITEKVIMVYWDQLGCGINNCVIDESFTVDLFVEMTVDLIKEVKQQFPDNRLVLCGVSWGSILAAKAAVEVADSIDRVVIYGQILSNLALNEEVYAILEHSKMSSSDRCKLNQIKAAKVSKSEDAVTVMKWIRKYTEGYQCKKGEKAPLGKVIRGIMKSPDYRMWDVKAVILNGYMKNTSLMEELTALDLHEDLKRITIPYSIIQGSTDIVASTKAISEYVRLMDKKNITCTIIPDSGHMPSAAGMQAVIQKCQEGFEGMQQ